jgi:hypothetical protein
VVSFRNALVVLTSNIGSRLISQHKAGLAGFAMRGEVGAGAGTCARAAAAGALLAAARPAPALLLLPWHCAPPPPPPPLTHTHDHNNHNKHTRRPCAHRRTARRPTPRASSAR